MNVSYKQRLKITVGILILISFMIISYFVWDPGHLWTDIKAVAYRPDILLYVFLAYLGAFVARGMAWKIYLQNKPSFLACIAGLFYSLLLNHLLPVKAGDIARIGILSIHEQSIPAEQTVNSVVVLRLCDMAILSVMSIIGLSVMDIPFKIPLVVILPAATITIFIGTRYFSGIIKRQFLIMREALSGWSGLLILMLTLISWILEAAVVFAVVSLAGGEINVLQAVWANSMTVAGQIFQATPGGIGTYEAVMISVLRLSSIPVKEAYSAAVITHALKYIFSFVAGTAAVAGFPVSIQTIKTWLFERSNKS